MKLMKKILAVMLTAVMCFGMFSVQTFAFGGFTSTISIYDANSSSTLTVSGSTTNGAKLTLCSDVQDNIIYDTLYLKQYLEVKSILGWSKYNAGSTFSKRLRNTASISMESIEVDIPAGTYRVYCEVTATPKSGAQQTIKFYSNECKVS